MRLPLQCLSLSILFKATGAVERGRMCKQHVTCMHAHMHALTYTHITWPCPSAAGDYVDYRMIRTPPPSSLPSFTVDLSAQQKPLRSEERPPVSSPSLWKGVVFLLRPELKNLWPSCELLLSGTKRHLMKRTDRRPLDLDLYIRWSWDMRDLRALQD